MVIYKGKFSNCAGYKLALKKPQVTAAPKLAAGTNTYSLLL